MSQKRAHSVDSNAESNSTREKLQNDQYTMGYIPNLGAPKPSGLARYNKKPRTMPGFGEGLGVVRESGVPVSEAPVLPHNHVCHGGAGGSSSGDTRPGLATPLSDMGTPLHSGSGSPAGLQFGHPSPTIQNGSDFLRATALSPGGQNLAKNPKYQYDANDMQSVLNRGAIIKEEMEKLSKNILLLKKDLERKSINLMSDPAPKSVISALEKLTNDLLKPMGLTVPIKCFICGKQFSTEICIALHL